MIEMLGARFINSVSYSGRFGRFFWQGVIASFSSLLKRDTYPLIWAQMNS